MDPCQESSVSLNQAPENSPGIWSFPADRRFSTAVHPNGLWIWRLSRLCSDYLQALQDVGCTRVHLKVFDDLQSAGGNFRAFQCDPALSSSFRSKGIEGFGWDTTLTRAR